MNYTVYLEIGDKKLKKTVEASSKKEAHEKVMAQIKLVKVVSQDEQEYNDVIQQFQDLLFPKK